MARRARPELPLVSLPCLSFVWELVTPPDWKAVDRGPGLIAGDRDGGSGWPLAALGLGSSALEFSVGSSCCSEHGLATHARRPARRLGFGRADVCVSG